MTARGWTFGGIALLSAVVAYFSMQPLLWLIAAPLCVLWFLCLLSVLCGRLMLRDHMRLEQDFVWLDGEATVSFVLRGCCLFPVCVRRTCTVWEQRVSCEQVCGFGRRHGACALTFSCTHVGKADYTLRAEIRDVFGLFRCSCRTGAAVPITVLPTVRAIQFLTEKVYSRDENTSRTALSDWGDTPADVREYREGDSIKHIHWKISLRQQKWYTRQFEEEKSFCVRLWMDAHTPTDDAAHYRDTLCVAAASIGNALLQKGAEIVLWDGGRTLTFGAGEKPHALYEALALYTWQPIAPLSEEEMPTMALGGSRPRFSSYVQGAFGAKGIAVVVPTTACGQAESGVWHWPQDFVM